MRTLLWTLGLILGCAWAADAAAPPVTSPASKTATVSDDTITVTAATGQSIGVWYIQTGAAIRDVAAITSDVNGSWDLGATAVVNHNCNTNARCVRLFVRNNNTAGTHTLTIDQTSTWIAYELAAFVFAPSGVSGVNVTDDTGGTTTSLPHPAASGSGINTAANVLLTAACVFNSTTTSPTSPTNWETERTNLTSQAVWAYEDDVATAFTNETATFSIITNARTSICAIAALTHGSPAPTGPPVGTLSLGGVGR